MTPNERLDNLLAGRPIDRPPFYPALYDYKSTLAEIPSHLFGQTSEQMTFALEKEVEVLQAEILTTAYDIYNVETEALGATVTRDPGLVLPEIHAPLITDLAQTESLPKLSAPSGRMALFIRAAEKAQQRFGSTLPVRGGLSGPFSMAAKLFPREELLIATVMDPDGVLRLLRFCTDTIKLYAEGFTRAGAGIALFDSFIVPPMLSPALYEELVLPFHQEIFSTLSAQGIKHRTLIAGGDTRPLLPHLVKTGANQLILDYNIPTTELRRIIETFPEVSFRINLSPALIAGGNPETIRNQVSDLLKSLGRGRPFILGTGILPPSTPQANILAARRSLLEFSL